MGKSGIDPVKIEVINKSLVYSTVTGCAIFITMLVFRFLNTSFNLSILFESLILLFLIITTIYRHHLSNKFKAMVIILLITVLSLFDVFFYGLLSTTRTFLILVPFFSIIYLSARRTLFISSLAITAFFILGYLHSHGVLSIPETYVPNTYITKFYPWIIHAFYLIAVGLIVYIITRAFMVSSSSLIAELQERNLVISENERNYREIFNSTSEAIFIHQAENGKISDVNEAMLKMYGYQSKQEVLELTLEELSDDRDHKVQEKAFSFLRKASEEGSQVFEWHARKKNGDLFLSEVSLRSTQLGGENRILAVVRDISERKRMEQKIAENEERYRKLIETSHDGISLMDLTGVMLFVNHKKVEMVAARNPTELVGQSAFNLLTPESVDTVGKLMPDLLARGFIDNLEIEVLRLDGKTFMAEFNVIVLKDSNGQPQYLMDTMRDITTRKQAENELINQSNFIASLLNAIPIPVYFKDKKGVFKGCNASFGNFTGTSSDQITGKLATQLWPDPAMIQQHKTDLELIKNPKLQIQEGVFIDKSGQPKDVIIARDVFHDQNGAVSGVIVALMDITEQKKSELQLENYKNHLELLVKKRTEELETANEELRATNDELYLQRETLESTLEKLQSAHKQLVISEKMSSLGMLAAGIAHDLNNPLNFINGGAIGLEDYLAENLPEHLDNVAPYLAGIQEGVKRSSDIVSSLNRYNRKNDLPKTNCDVHFIINNCLVMLQNQTKDTIGVVKEFCKEPVVLSCNESKLHQAILNILSNAIQAIEDQGSITITTQVKKNQLTLQIKDTGCGIQPENIQKITDPFFTTKEPGKGTGLGLSITQNIILEMRGTLNFTSQKEEGTTVTITLPLTKTKSNE
jgi:PAS domain S-box-containing protein